MRRLLAIAAVTICLHTQAQAQGIQCPEPMKQVGANIKGEIDAQAQGLLKVAGGELKGAVETSVVNLFEKYPNADRIAVIQNYQSMTCYLIKDSSLPDEKKFGMIMELANYLEKYLR